MKRLIEKIFGKKETRTWRCVVIRCGSNVVKRNVVRDWHISIGHAEA